MKRWKRLCSIFSRTGKSGAAWAAYETIRDIWNAEHAADVLLRFADGLRQGRIEPEEAGPLSAAPIIKPGSKRNQESSTAEEG